MIARIRKMFQRKMFERNKIVGFEYNISAEDYRRAELWVAADIQKVITTELNKTS